MREFLVYLSLVLCWMGIGAFVMQSLALSGRFKLEKPTSKDYLWAMCLGVFVMPAMMSMVKPAREPYNFPANQASMLFRDRRIYVGLQRNEDVYEALSHITDIPAQTLRQNFPHRRHTSDGVIFITHRAIFE